MLSRSADLSLKLRSRKPNSMSVRLPFAVPVPSHRSAFRAALPAVKVIFFLLLGLATLAPAAQAIRFGPPKPACEDGEKSLEGTPHVEVMKVSGEDPRWIPLTSGRAEPVVLLEGEVYHLRLTMGSGEEAPTLPARYRLENRSFAALTAHGLGEGAFPLVRHYSINTLARIQLYARNPGRRYLYLRLSECYTGGSRFLYAPAEAVLPVVVRRNAER